MLFSLEVIALMPILIVTSGPQHGDIGSGIGAAGRKAKGITQYRVVFVNFWGHLAGTAWLPCGSPPSSLGREVLLRRPWPTLGPRHDEALDWRQYSELSGSGKANGGNMADPEGKATKSGNDQSNGTNRFEGTDHERAEGSQPWFGLA